MKNTKGWRSRGGAGPALDGARRALLRVGEWKGVCEWCAANGNGSCLHTDIASQVCAKRPQVDGHRRVGSLWCVCWELFFQRSDNAEEPAERETSMKLPAGTRLLRGVVVTCLLCEMAGAP